MNSNTVRKRLRGPRQDYGDGLSANGKTGLFGSNYQSFMSEGTKHLTMPTSAASAISRLGREPLFASTKDGERAVDLRSEEHTSELQSRVDLVCRLLLEKKKEISEEGYAFSWRRAECRRRLGGTEQS